MALTSWIVPIMHKIANHSKLYWDAYWLVLNISPCFALITRMDIYCFLHIHCHHPSPFWGLWTKYILTSLPTLGSCASDQTQHDTCSPDPNYSVTHFALVSVMISGKVICPNDFSAVPKLFGTRDWFPGRQFFHRPGVEGIVSGWFKCIAFIVLYFLIFGNSLLWSNKEGNY